MPKSLVFSNRRRAMTIVFVVVLMPVLFGFAALAIDLGSRAVVQSELQNAVDAAVLAGVQDLKGDPPDPDAARSSALDILRLNVSYRQVNSDIASRTIMEIGGVILDAMTGEFVFQPGVGWDAMRISVTSEQDYFFAALLGVYSTTVTGMATGGLMERPPIALWRLADTVWGTAVDEVGAHDGQHFGDVDLSFAGVIPGDYSTRIATGMDDAGRIEIPHSDDFLLDQGTVILWFKTGDTAGRHGLFSKDSSGYDTGGHLDIHFHENHVHARLQSATSSYYLQSPALASNVWHQVVVSFGLGGFKLFLDGTEVGSSSYTGGLGTTSGGAGNYEPITLGVGQTTSENLSSTGWNWIFHGRIDEVAIYNRGVAAGEVLWLYNAVQAQNVNHGAVVRDGLLRL
ncbi:MAG: hypothetical protein IH989_00710 [Planctomycetes bacterium]|nr:hypothetical protein [Planctomycetota bacterium]